MKRWWKFLAVFFLGIILSLVSNMTAFQVQAVPPQLVTQAQEAYEAGEFGTSLKLLEQAEVLYQDKTKYLQQAQIYSLMSLAQQQLDNWNMAEEKIRASFTLLETISPSNRKNQVLAKTWLTKGNLELGRGKNRQALKDWKQAEQLYQAVKDPIGIAGSLLNQAKALEKMGFYPRSCDRILVAFNYSESSCENLTLSEIKTIINRVETNVQPWHMEGLNQLGNILLLTGKLSQAETVIHANQKINHHLKNQSFLETAKILLNLGNINKAIAFQAREFEDMPRFLEYATTSEEYYQKLNDYQPTSQVASLYKLPAQLNLLSLFVATKQWSKAQDLVKEIQLPTQAFPQKQNLYGEIKFALDLQRLKDKQIEVLYSWQDIANIYLDVIEQAKKVGNLRAQSYAIGYLGMLQKQQSQLKIVSTPEQLISEALNLAQQIRAAEIAYRWQWQLGKIYAEKSQRKLAIASYKTSLISLDSLRQDLASLTKEIQFDFHEQIEPIYKEYAELLLASKSLSNLDMANAVDAIESLQVAELDNYFQDACITSNVKNINQIDKNAIAIYTLVLPDSLEVIMAMNNSEENTASPTFRHHRANISQEDLETIVQQLRSYITEPDRTVEVKKLSQQLYNLLIEPFASDLNERQPNNLVFILDGILQTIPMSALHDGEQYLLEKYAIALTPGLRMLNLQTPTEKQSFLAGGITKPLQIDEQKFSALNNVETELDLFAQSDSKILLDHNFTATNLLAQINNTSASHIHIATHGQFNSNPNKTFLLMWQNLLTIKDFGDLLQKRQQRIEIPLDLLVLSACDTASGDRFAALGLAGVAVRSGALTTLATLWQVNDESTATLMKSFYQHLQENHSKAEALRLSQLDLWQRSDKDWEVPAFWSAFVIIGNWN